MRLLRRLFWIFLVLAATPVMAQSLMERLVTPGPLSNAHARLESRCESCHTSFSKGAQNTKCADCHKGIRSDIAQGSHFHGKFAPARNGTCKSCHSEHKGRGFNMIQLNRTTFNHALSEYPLTGAHNRVTCTGCHGPTHEYRGTPRDCASCHARKDPHKGQLGRGCQSCHTTAAWKTVLPFDHGKTRFALTGAHRGAACMSCHAGQRWKGLGTTCVSCHVKDDAHKGTRGTNCASCHTTTAWKAVTFDHSRTGYPLVGGHATASCAGCHGPGNANLHPARTCISCHARDDAHKGENGKDCANCHTPRSWKQVNFDHDKMTSFPLKGAHREAVCAGCHKQAPKVAKPPVTCNACHAADDTHKGGNGPDCARCHNETAWKSVSFNHATMTGFPLIGKHAQARCEACHVRPASEVKLMTQCGSCHTKDDVHAANLGGDCQRCHSNESWKIGIRFDHDLTRFPLLGKHAALQCTQCHAGKDYGAKGVTCASCHKDDHHRGTLGTPAQCQNCHNANDWKAWNFDHDRATNFPLTGRHRGLICSACHNRPGDPAELGTQCGSCHQRDDVHRGGFGEDCAQCHVTTNFREILINSRRGKAAPQR